MTPPRFEPFASAWADAMKHAPLDEQRSLVRFLESVSVKPVSKQGRSMGPLLALAAGFACVLGLAGYLYTRSATAPLLVSRDITPGTWLVTRDQKVPLNFSEGSHVEVAEASRIRVNSVDPHGAVVVVESGSVRAKIVHRKDTRWAFAAGPFNVRVTGTILRVNWRPERQEFELGVDEGSVVAQGPLLGNGHVLTSGQTCVVRMATAQVDCSSKAAPTKSADEPKREPTESRDVSLLPLVEETTEAPEAPLPSSVLDFSRVRALENDGKFAEALAMAERLGLEQLLRTGNSEVLFCLSRLGRYQGNATLARGALVKLRDRFGKTKEASNAAFLLGRQAPPAEAARWLLTYLKEQPQGTFAREAAGRLMESYQRAGQFSEAQSAARRYLNAYPTGPHAGFAKSLLANP